jgi:CheY-like chemotaxis protein
MTWVLVTGEDGALYQNILQVLRPAGYDVVAAADGAVALQMLGDMAPTRSMVVLLRPQMGRMDVAEFLGAVAVDADLPWRHTYILLDGTPDQLPVEAQRYLDLLAVPVIRTPADASDDDGWADLLDAIELAARHLPSEANPTG